MTMQGQIQIWEPRDSDTLSSKIRDRSVLLYIKLEDGPNIYSNNLLFQFVSVMLDITDVIISLYLYLLF